ncbi:MAG: histidine kinase dimerization/phospho-acceptor domain-containing protein, partial [Phenylobacterium sp.]
MADPALHRLLQRQLARARAPSGEVDVDRLLGFVSQAYEEQDELRIVHERATHVASEEMRGLSEQLRAESEARAREAARVEALLACASEAIISTGADWRIIQANQAAERLFDYAPGALIGVFVGELIANWPAPDVDIWSLEPVRNLSEVATKPIEGVGRRSSGETFEAEVSASRLDFDGEIIVTGFWRDISQRKAEAAAMLAMRDQAEAANRAKSDFLATMSHEIRTPLNGVLGMAQAMAAEPLSDTQRERVEIIRQSGENLLTLLNDLLDLSKIEAGRMELEAVDFDLPRLFKDVL